MFSLKAVFAGLLLGLLVWGCGSSAVTPSPASSSAAMTSQPSLAMTSPSPSPAASATASATATDAGQASQNLVLTGATGLDGPLGGSAVRCSEPFLGGLQIVVRAFPADRNLTVLVAAQLNSVSVKLESGSGQTYAERDFTGPGVSDFNAGLGVQIDATLTETANNLAHGNLGQITAIKGQINCGNQTTGTSSLIFAGTTAKGSITGGLSSASVQCQFDNNYGWAVSTFGLVNIANDPTPVEVYLTSNYAEVILSYNTYFFSQANALVNLTQSGATVSATVYPDLSNATYSFTIKGDLTCGSTLLGA
jgi:hypothetical protein